MLKATVWALSRAVSKARAGRHVAGSDVWVTVFRGIAAELPHQRAPMG